LKAAILRTAGKISLEEIPAPSISPDEVLVKVRACGICGSDVQYLQGVNPWSLHTLGQDEPTPQNVILGHEIAGEIADANQASKSRIGEHVAINTDKPCMKCHFCKLGRTNLCENVKHIGHDGRWGEVDFVPGGYADYCRIWDTNACTISPQIDFEEGSQLDGLGVAVHAVKSGRIHPEDSIVVIGNGAVGLMTMQVAKAYGAGLAICVDRFPKPLDIALKLGADVAVDSSKEDLVRKVMSSTKNMGADAIFDTVGTRNTVTEGLRALRRGGVLVMLGGFKDSLEIDLTMLSGERILTSSSNNLAEEFHEAIKLLESHRIKVKPFITHRFSLSQIEQAFRVASNKTEYEAIKVVILP
jgi:2-desacetyl-2-hydroxyethyl bacteriochlorophyllide A dehydrogenase